MSNSADQDVQLRLARLLKDVDEHSDVSVPDAGEHLALARRNDTLLEGEPDVDVEELARFERARRGLELIHRLRKLKSSSHATATEGETRGTNQQPVDTVSLPNETLARVGRFEILRELGRGGFGVVFLANDPRLGREVALKVPRPEVLITDESRQRFEREARAAGVLSHPAIVPIYETGTAGALNYIAFEYCEGVSLARWFAENGRELPWQAAVRVIAQLADAVQHAHSRGVVHRDLKPGNILVAGDADLEAPDDFQPKITDFGLAKLDGADVTNLTQTGALIGTPAYMSPEQARGDDDIGPATDIYALGAILYELVTGHPPLGKNSSVASLLAIQTEEPVAPRKIQPDVPRDLEAICLRCLEKDPARRYATALDLNADIQRFLSNEPIAARPPTIWYQAQKFARRNRALVGGLVAVLITLAAGACTTAWQAYRAVGQRDRAAEQALRAGETAALLSRMILAVTPEIARGAEPTIRQMLDETSRELRTDDSIHPVVAADTHRILARAYRDLGHFDDSEFHARQALTTHTELHGPNSADALETQAVLADLLTLLERYQEAEAMARDGLQRARAHLGPKHDVLISMINVYAFALGETADADDYEVARCYREAFELLTEKYGRESRRTLVAASNLGSALLKLDRIDEGERLLKDVYDVRLARFGEDHPDTITARNNLAFALDLRGDPKGAIELARPQVAMAEKVFGKGHPRTIHYRLQLASLEMTQGQHDAAASTARAALDGAIPRLGRLHKQTLQAHGLLVNALVAMGKTDEAEPLALEQYQLCLESFGNRDPHTVEAVTLLFNLAEARNDLERMRHWAEELRGTQWETPALDMVRQAEAKVQGDER